MVCSSKLAACILKPVINALLWLNIIHTITVHVQRTFAVPVMGFGTATLMENTTAAVKAAFEIGYR